MANPNPERIYNARNASEYVEIVNYVSTVRSNADFQQAGIQTTAFVRDALGVPQSYDDTALNWGGDGDGDTQWIPQVDEDWSIEQVIENNRAILALNGVDRSPTHSSVLAGMNGDSLYVNIGSNVTTYSPIGYGKHHIIVSYSSLNNEYDVYVDGVYNQTVNISTIFEQPTYPFYIGAANRSTIEYFMDGPQELFKIHQKALTATEALEAYNTWIGA